MDAQIHFEIFVRSRLDSPWTLEGATESRTQALDVARQLLKEGRAVGAKITKETFDEESREFRTVVIDTVGVVTAAPERKVRERAEPLCVMAQDLYTLHARAQIGRLLDGWLDRQRATTFELLHRADLVELLERSGTDLQHAIQKIAIPEAQARGASVHELIRGFNDLVDRAIKRLQHDCRRDGAEFKTPHGFTAAARRLSARPEGAYQLGIGVAAYLAESRTWGEKINRLLDLADAAPAEGADRRLALNTLAQPLNEIFERKTGLDDLIDRGLEMGRRLALMIRVALRPAVDELAAGDPALASVLPDLPADCARLAAWLASPEFAEAQRGLLKRVLRRLREPRRLAPADPVSEIVLLRALAGCLAAARGILPATDLRAAITARSKTLVSSSFLESYLNGRSALQEGEALIWLAENVLGDSNKREAARCLDSLVSGLRFEAELLKGSVAASTRLQALAQLQRRARACGLGLEETARIEARLGELGGMIEAEGKLVQVLGAAKAPLAQRLRLLLQFSNGEAAPIGPAAARARREALRLLRTEAGRAELIEGPGADEIRRALAVLAAA